MNNIYIVAVFNSITVLCVRVCLCVFSLDGIWIRIVVSARDGIKEFMNNSYHLKHPQFLWVSYIIQNVNKYYIKRFKAINTSVWCLVSIQIDSIHLIFRH